MANTEPDSANLKLSMLVGPSLNAIPYVGGVLAAAWSEWDNNRRFNRVEATMHEIGRLLVNRAINPDAASDEGMHLLELVLREAQIEHSEKKRRLLANLVVSSWIDDEPPRATFDESLLFLHATATFTESHMAILDCLYSAGEGGSVAFTDLRALISDAQDSDGATLIILNALCSQFSFAKRSWDLNQPNSKGAILSSRHLSPEGMARKCFHAITERGRRYCDYVVRGPNASEEDTQHEPAQQPEVSLQA